MKKYSKTTKQSRTPQNKHTEYIIKEQGELMDFLLETVKQMSRNSIKSLLKFKQVSVNDKVVSQFNHPLEIGDSVKIKNPGASQQEYKNPLKILYEDSELVVINKPAGLLSIASDKERERTAYTMLTEYVRQDDPKNRVFIIHRLDRDTSGVFMIAKTEEVKRAFQDDWDKIITQRGYTAVTEGQFKEKSGTVRSFLMENSIHLMYSRNDGEGLEAITHYKVTKESSEYSLVDIRIETGRKNQIRVHMKDLGHSVAGDKKYGAKTNPLKRLGLHAHKLELNHPVTGKKMTFDAPVPRVFTDLVKK